MKKFALCIISLLVSIPLSAGLSGLSVGATGGIERLTFEEGDTETLTAIGLTVTFSLPVLPVGIRGGLEYAWNSKESPYGDASVTFYDFLFLLGIEYYIAPPMSPLSFYVGAGFETSTFWGDALEIAELLEPGESITKTGFLVYGGVNLRVGPITVFAESGYGMIFSEVFDAHIPIRGGVKVSL